MKSYHGTDSNIVNSHESNKSNGVF